MPDDPKRPEKPPVGDPPPPPKPVKAMQDPFTEQSTHPANEGQGSNRPQRDKEAPGENEEEAMPVEEGFSPVP